jgi:hypothetical protein
MGETITAAVCVERIWLGCGGGGDGEFDATDERL